MFEPRLSVLALDDGLYETLEKGIAAAVQQAPNKTTKRKTSKRGAAIPQEQLDDILATGEESYLNEEWAEAIRTYSELLESGADLPPYIGARLALSFTLVGDWEAAFEHATTSYENNPAESAAYIAMARCAVLGIASMPEAGLKWLELASKANNIPERIFSETKQELEETVVQNEQEERYAVSFLQQPNVYERVSQNPEFTSLVDMEELKVALTAAQQDLSLLKETRGRSPGLSALLKILYNDADVLLPQVLTNDDTILLLQKSCPLHHLGGELFRRVASFLPLPSIANLQSTCKINRYWANHPDLWKEVYCRTWEPLQPSTFGVPCLPYMWKYHLKSRHGLLAASRAVFDTIMHQRAAPSDIEDMRKRALTKLAKKYRSSSAPAAAGTLANQFIETIDLFATSTTPYNAISLFDSPAFLTVMVTSLTRVGFNSSILEVQTALLALICGALAGGPQVSKSLLLLGVKTICSNLMYGPVHTEACALLAVLRLGETSFARPVKPVMPSSFWCANFPEDRLHAATEKLTGVWRHFMFYDNSDVKSVIELGASRLQFDVLESTISGHGSDTIGPFEVLEGSNFNLRTGEITIARQYDGMMLEFIGCATPFGFGGFFQALSEDPEEPAPLLGYWMSHYMYESMTDDEWKVFLADSKSKAARRGMSKHPRPWQEEPGPLGSLSQELRQLTRNTFTMSLPSATCADIYAQQESLPNVSDEEVSKLESPSLLRGLGESDEKFLLRTRTHSIMMMLLFERRAAFGLAKWEEVENDLQALESPNPATSPAILHKWHDYLCLYTFDNYAISSGVDGVCQWFRMVLSMAQDIRSRGQDPAVVGLGADPNQPGDAFDDDMDRLPENLPSRTTRDADEDSDSAEDIIADDASSSIGNSMSTLPTIPKLATTKTTASPSKSTKLSKDTYESDDESDSDSDSEDSGSDAGSVSATRQRSRRAARSGVSPTTLVVAAGVIAAVSAGVYALTRFLERPKGTKK